MQRDKRCLNGVCFELDFCCTALLEEHSGISLVKLGSRFANFLEAGSY